MQKYGNIITQARADQLPAMIDTVAGRTYSPTWAQCVAAGWRRIISVESVPVGWRVVRYTLDEIDGETCADTVAERANIADENAAATDAKLATLTPELVQKAALFRSILRARFGDGAETNLAINRETVSQHFVGLRIAGNVQAKDVADAVILDSLFGDLAAWTGTGETWSFPWGVVP